MLSYTTNVSLNWKSYAREIILDNQVQNRLSLITYKNCKKQEKSLSWKSWTSSWRKALKTVLETTLYPWFSNWYYFWKLWECNQRLILFSRKEMKASFTGSYEALLFSLPVNTSSGGLALWAKNNWKRGWFNFLTIFF